MLKRKYYKRRKPLKYLLSLSQERTDLESISYAQMMRVEKCKITKIYAPERVDPSLIEVIVVEEKITVTEESKEDHSHQSVPSP